MYNAAVRHRMSAGIAQFIKFTKNTCISKITKQHIEAFYAEMLKTQRPYTVDKKVQHVKRLFTYAANNHYIELSPFANYRFPSLPKLTPISLTDKEIKLIASKRLHSERLEYIRDLFLFQCHTGFAYKDIFAFTKEVITTTNGHHFLNGARQKNGQPFFLPFLPEAESIAKKYKYTFRRISNQKFNDYLKEIAILCRINKAISTHVGRKTFGQMMIDRGYSAESVSKMLGHVSFDMTQKHYARISETRVEREYQQLHRAA